MVFSEIEQGFVGCNYELGEEMSLDRNRTRRALDSIFNVVKGAVGNEGVFWLEDSVEVVNDFVEQSGFAVILSGCVERSELDSNDISLIREMVVPVFLYVNPEVEGVSWSVNSLIDVIEEVVTRSNLVPDKLGWRVGGCSYLDGNPYLGYLELIKRYRVC